MYKDFKTLTIRIPSDLHRQLKIQAAQENKTITEIIIGFIEKKLSQGDKDGKDK